MALNFPGPYELRFTYTVSSRQHSHRVNLQLAADLEPGGDFSTAVVVNRGNTMNPFLDDAITAYAGLWRGFMDDTVATIDFAELWKYDEGSFDATFIGAQAINLAGTNTATHTIGGQVIVTYRTTGGGVMKQSFMESNIPAPSLPDTLPFANAELDALADFVVSTAGWLLGRDNNYPIAVIASYAGHNEALLKRIYRP